MRPLRRAPYKRPKALFGSSITHPVIDAVEWLEPVIRSRENEDYDEDEETAARAKYNLELRRLEDCFPEYAVRALAMAHASQHHTRPCPCGRGCLARWPWVVQTAAQGFCDCDMAFWERTCWRCDWLGFR